MCGDAETELRNVGRRLAPCTASEHKHTRIALLAFAGRYGGSTGLTSSTACFAAAAGYYSSLGGTTQAACPAGKYSLAAATVCTNCAAGTYNGAAARGSACATVPAGSYASLVLNGAGVASAATIASPCAAGKYSTAGLSVCTQCTAGEWRWRS